MGQGQVARTVGGAAEVVHRARANQCGKRKEEDEEEEGQEEDEEEEKRWRRLYILILDSMTNQISSYQE